MLRSVHLVWTFADLRQKLSVAYKIECRSVLRQVLLKIQKEMEVPSSEADWHEWIGEWR
jgi:hypothetical protein